MPGDPSGAVMNSIPCASRQLTSLDTVDLRKPLKLLDISIFAIVWRVIATSSANRSTVQPSADLAARICEGTNT
jgi:hypothetical protein